MEKKKNRIAAFFENASPKKKILLGVLAGAVCLAVVLTVLLVWNGKGKNVAKESHTVEVVTVGGKGVSGIEVSVYQEEEREHLLVSGTTDTDGACSFEVKKGAAAVVTLQNVPEGYEYEEAYAIAGEKTVVELALPEVGNLEEASFQLGDVLWDLQVTDTEGQTYTLSQLLKEKKAVVLNFWYLTCEPCREEFPFLQEAYEAYQEDVAVLAVNPVNNGSEDGEGSAADALAQYKEDNHLTFPLAALDSGWIDALGILEYPTTVVVDSYGRVSLIHSSAVTDAEAFPAVFQFFTKDTYTHKTVASLSDLLKALQTEDANDKLVGDDYGITVTDELGAGIPQVGVTVYKGTDIVATLATDDNGLAVAQLEPGDYKVLITAPAGFKTDDSEYKLTATEKQVAVTLYKKTDEVKEFTVNVVDEKGKAVNGALVAVGTEFGYTNVAGMISFKLIDDNYTAAVSASGYVSASVGFNGKTTVTVTLKKGTASGETYSVTVKDYAGQGIKDVAVTFYQGNTVSGVATTTSGGEATVKLSSGTYTIALAGDYDCDSSNITLTASKKSISVTAAKRATQMEKLYYDSTTWYVNTGGTYVECEPNTIKEYSGINFFIFQPAAEGTYRVTTSTPTAVVSLYSGTKQYLTGVAETGSQITLNVKESALGRANIFGVTGTSECILIVERTGSAQYEDVDKPWTVYEGNYTPTASFPAGTGTLTSIGTPGTTTLVKDPATGFYHVGSVTGPLAYVNFTECNADISVNITEMLGLSGQMGGVNFGKYFYDGNGTFVKKELYNALLTKYIECKGKDTVCELYPLTDDLIYMITEGGDYKGWWTFGHGNYLFGSTKVDKDKGYEAFVYYFQ